MIGFFSNTHLFSCYMCSAFGPAATATMATDNLPFVLNDDKALLCLVKQGSKEVMTLADAMVSVTRSLRSMLLTTACVPRFRHLVFSKVDL